MAWQRGLVPVGEAAILRAIELNGAAVALNRRAFLWGRILAEHPDLAAEIAGGAGAARRSPARRCPCRPWWRCGRRRWRTTSRRPMRRATARVLDQVMARERAVFGRVGRLSRAVAEGLFRLMAYKDEYEVARLHAAASYGAAPVFHLAPPLLTRVDPATGRKRKIAVPGWLAGPLFRALRHGRVLRGSWADPFGWQAERRAERALVTQYVADVEAMLARAVCRDAGDGGGAGGTAGDDPGVRAGEGREPGEGGEAAGGVAGADAGGTRGVGAGLAGGSGGVGRAHTAGSWVVAVVPSVMGGCLSVMAGEGRPSTTC